MCLATLRNGVDTLVSSRRFSVVKCTYEPPCETLLPLGRQAGCFVFWYRTACNKSDYDRFVPIGIFLLFITVVMTYDDPRSI